MYAALLNDPSAITALGDAVHQPPYKAAPAAPVLGVKPRNTLAPDAAAIALPAEPGCVVVGATLAIVIARTACRLTAANALAHVAGYGVAADLSLPLASHYRPAARSRVRDGFCPLGAKFVPAAQIADPDALAVTVAIDGAQVYSGSTSGRVRGVVQLLVDVTEFMTLSAGDLLLLGAPAAAPQARMGQAVAVAIAGVGALRFSLVTEQAEAAA